MFIIIPICRLVTCGFHSCYERCHTDKPVLSQPSNMKVVSVIIVLLASVYSRFHYPRMVRNWDNSLVGLDFLAFGNNHLEFQTRVWKLQTLVILFSLCSGSRRWKREEEDHQQQSKPILHTKNNLSNTQI